MARTRMVTRTIIETKATVITMNVKSCEVEIKTFSLTGSGYENNEKTLKALRKLYETSEVKLVNINSLEESEELYGMLETDFIKSAHKLDKETRKLLEENADAEITVEDDTEVTETK